MDPTTAVLYLLTGGIYPALWWIDRRMQRECRKGSCLRTLHLTRHPEDTEILDQAGQD